MRWLIALLTIIPLLITRPVRAESERGALVITVRDPQGQPLPNVELQIDQDTDDQGRVMVGTYTTDDQGDVHLLNLPYGLYILTFIGTTPTGQPMQPAREQNLGLAEDGTGIDGGFGLRFTEPRFTLLFVLNSQTGVPLFDAATNRRQPPQPIDPLLELLARPTPTPFTIAQAQDQRDHATSNPPPIPLWCSVPLVSLMLGCSVLLGVGWWRTRKGTRS